MIGDCAVALPNLRNGLRPEWAASGQHLRPIGSPSPGARPCNGARNPRDLRNRALPLTRTRVALPGRGAVSRCQFSCWANRSCWAAN